jgi:hypothetical protein
MLRLTSLAFFALLASAGTAAAAPCARPLPSQLPHVACPTASEPAICSPCIRGQSNHALTYDIPMVALGERWRAALAAAGWTVELTSMKGGVGISAQKGESFVGLSLAPGKTAATTSALLTLITASP